MKKNDLKSGYVVKLRNGDLYMIMPSEDGLNLLNKKNEWLSFKSLTEDLRCDPDSQFDIVAVRGFTPWGYMAFEISEMERPLLWERTCG